MTFGCFIFSGDTGPDPSGLYGARAPTDLHVYKRVGNGKAKQLHATFQAGNSNSKSKRESSEFFCFCLFKNLSPRPTGLFLLLLLLLLLQLIQTGKPGGLYEFIIYVVLPLMVFGGGRWFLPVFRCHDWSSARLNCPRSLAFH